MKKILKATLFAFLFIVLFFVLSLFKGLVSVNFERVIHGLIGTLAALITTVLFLKYDKLKWADIGLVYTSKTFLNFGKGILLGCLLMGALTLGVVYLSGFKMVFNSNFKIAQYFIITLHLIPLAFMEELAFRAYPLRVLQKVASPRIVVYFTAFLFGAYHIANGWTLQNAFLGAAVWGIIYGTAALYSGGIALPTGLHFACNWVTSAFAISAEKSNLFILQSAAGGSLANYQSSNLAELLPQLIVLVIGICGLELYIKNSKKLA